MKLTKSFEQAVCIMAMLSTQEIEIPITSETINLRLQCSYTYLRKIMRKLVVSGLVTSVPGNKGGFSLAKDANDISILDIVEAVEGPVDTYQTKNLIQNVFQDGKSEYVESGTERMQSIFRAADKKWSEELDTVKVAKVVYDVLKEKSLNSIDWNKETQKEQHSILKELSIRITDKGSKK